MLTGADFESNRYLEKQRAFLVRCFFFVIAHVRNRFITFRRILHVQEHLCRQSALVRN